MYCAPWHTYDNVFENSINKYLFEKVFCCAERVCWGAFPFRCVFAKGESAGNIFKEIYYCSKKADFFSLPNGTIAINILKWRAGAHVFKNVNNIFTGVFQVF